MLRIRTLGIYVTLQLLNDMSSPEISNVITEYNKISERLTKGIRLDLLNWQDGKNPRSVINIPKVTLP